MAKGSIRAKARKGRDEVRTEQEHAHQSSQKQTPERKRLKPRRTKPVPKWVKDAADRAEARAKGQDPYQDEPKAKIDPYGPDDPPTVPLPRTKPAPARRRLKTTEDSDSITAPPLPVSRIVPLDETETIITGLTERKRDPSPTRYSEGNKHFKKLLGSYRSDYPSKAAKLVLNGAIERDIIAYFQVTKKVFDLWQAMYPEFAAALVIGKEASLADQRVVRSVYEMANGYEVSAVKIFNNKGEPMKVRYKEQVPKNINAAKFWLANRDPDNWGRDPEKSSDDASRRPSVLNVNMIRSMDTQQLQQLFQLLKSMVTPNSGLKRLDGISIENQAEMYNDADDLELTATKVEEQDDV